MTHLYSAQNLAHDLAISDRYFSLTPEERDTWKTESECRDIFAEHIRQLRDQGRRPARMNCGTSSKRAFCPCLTPSTSLRAARLSVSRS